MRCLAVQTKEVFDFRWMIYETIIVADLSFRRWDSKALLKSCTQLRISTMWQNARSRPLVLLIEALFVFLRFEGT